MSRYTGPTWKISRRLGYSISETGKEIAKRNYAPGQHGQRRSKISEYGVQQKEKQKVRFTYGMGEKQFKRTFNAAGKQGGVHGERFLILLERRLDNVVYRLAFAKTRAQARQLVNHGHILVDGKKVDIPSYVMTPGQTITFREKSKDLVVVKAAIDATFARVPYVSFNEDTMVGTFERLPERSEFLPEIKEQLIVEYYSR